MSELIDPLVNENSVEPSSEIHNEVAHTPLSDTRRDNESLNASSIVGLELGHQGLAPSDALGVARINPPSEVGCNSDSLDVGNDIGYRIEQVKVETLTILGSILSRITIIVWSFYKTAFRPLGRCETQGV